MACMRVFESMAFTDRIVFDVLKVLVEARGEDEFISQVDIAEFAGMSLRTTQAALSRLMKSGHITGVFTAGRSNGYKYRINNGSNPPAARRAAATRTA